MGMERVRARAGSREGVAGGAIDSVVCSQSVHVLGFLQERHLCLACQAVGGGQVVRSLSFQRDEDEGQTYYQLNGTGVELRPVKEAIFYGAGLEGLHICVRGNVPSSLIQAHASRCVAAITSFRRKGETGGAAFAETPSLPSVAMD